MQRLSKAWWALLMLLTTTGPSSAQIVIPPPDDLIPDPVIMPQTAPSPLPDPAPPPPPAPSAMTSDEAKAEARATGSQLREAYSGLPTSAEGLGSIPGYVTDEPALTSHYDNPDGLGSAGAAAAVTSEGWQTANASGRPNVTVTRGDMARAVAIEADPESWLEGQTLGGAAADCRPLPPSGGAPTMAEWTCNVGASIVEAPQSCTRALDVSRWDAQSYQYLCSRGAGWNSCASVSASPSCTRETETVIAEFGITVETWRCNVPIPDPALYLLGTTALPPPPDAFEVAEHVYRCNGDGLTDAFTLEPLTGAISGYVTGLQGCTALEAAPGCSPTSAAAAGIDERVLCKSWRFVGGPFFGGSLICDTWAAPERVYSCTAPVAGLTADKSQSHWFTQQWIESACAADPATCTLSSERCTAPDETRLIDGIAVTRPCWEQRKDYQCQKIVGGGNDCGALEAQPGCRLARELCLDDPPDPVSGCTVTERVYECPIPGTTPAPPQYICGDDVYCLGGECESVTREASDEFKDAVVALNALGQANSEFDETTLTLFRGTRETCHKKVFGLSNCCSGKGVPLLTPFLCSAAERQLDEKDDKGLCHKVGTYCSDRVLGVCVTRKDAHCCFQSKISRILQEQGRPQIGKAWGPPKTEQCAGFTIAEFQQLDLSVMDFAEVYAEFEEAVRLPDEAQALAEMQTKIRDYYARNPGGH